MGASEKLNIDKQKLERPELGPERKQEEMNASEKVVLPGECCYIELMVFGEGWRRGCRTDQPTGDGPEAENKKASHCCEAWL